MSVAWADIDGMSAAEIVWLLDRIEEQRRAEAEAAKAARTKKR